MGRTGRRGARRRGVRDGWMDGWTDKTETTGHSHPKQEGMWRGTGWVQRDWKACGQRETGEEWRWRTLAVRTGAGMDLDLISQVSSHYLCLLLSPLGPITATMQQAPSCRATYGSLVVKPSLPSEAMQFLMGTACENSKGHSALLFDWACAALRACLNMISCECWHATSLSQTTSNCVGLNHLQAESTSTSAILII